jgi:hypothetical protein
MNTHRFLLVTNGASGQAALYALAPLDFTEIDFNQCDGKFNTACGPDFADQAIG